MSEIYIGRYPDDRLVVYSDGVSIGVDIEDKRDDGKWYVDPEAGISIPMHLLDAFIAALNEARKG